MHPLKFQRRLDGERRDEGRARAEAFRDEKRRLAGIPPAAFPARSPARDRFGRVIGEEFGERAVVKPFSPGVFDDPWRQPMKAWADRLNVPPAAFLKPGAMPPPAERPKPAIRKSADAYARRLRRRGFALLGSGFFSDVYARPGSPWVVKVGRHERDVWPEYATLVMERHTDNPFAPRIRRLKRHKGFYVAVIERLDTTVRAASAEETLVAAGIRAVAADAFFEAAGKRVRETGKPVKPGSLLTIEHHYPQLAALIRDVGTRIADLRLDVHDENMMLARDPSAPLGFRFVVTDPISQGTYRRAAA